MLERVAGEATRMRALVIALEQEEITLSEFSDVARSLSPETVQVIALLLRDWDDLSSEERERLGAARILCSRIASSRRALS
jgi:hypothetical protein